MMESTAFVAITICIISAAWAQLPLPYYERPDIITTNTRCIACTRAAAFRTNIDGQDTIAQCSSGNDVRDRCQGCCEVYAIYNGRQKALNGTYIRKNIIEHLTRYDERNRQRTDAKETNNLRSYHHFEKIGEGAYGVVYKAMHKQTQKPVAIKMIRLERREEGIPATTMREIALLRELIHPHIIYLQGVIMQECRIYLVFEYIEMDLRRYIDLLPDNQLMDKTERRVMHRDLKPQNLLVDANGILKLADFGLARAVGIPLRAYTHEVVTLWYRAPEILLGAERYTLGVDMWSIGCIFAEMATKLPLFEGDSEIAQIFSIFSILSTPTEQIWPGVTLLPDYQEEFPQWKHCILDTVLGRYMDSTDLNILKYGNCLQTMVTYDPARRISAKKLLMNPYFKDIDWEKMKKLSH